MHLAQNPSAKGSSKAQLRACRVNFVARLTNCLPFRKEHGSATNASLRWQRKVVATLLNAATACNWSTGSIVEYLATQRRFARASSCNRAAIKTSVSMTKAVHPAESTPIFQLFVQLWLLCFPFQSCPRNCPAQYFYRRRARRYLKWTAHH